MGLTTELCRAVKLKNNMEMEQMVACPRCGSEPVLEKIYDNTEITTAKCSNANCKHSSVTGLNEGMARNLWNIRAGGRKPAMPETVGVKALASATGSAARLWRVTVEFELVVEAKTELDAEILAEHRANQDGSDAGLVVATQLRRIEDAPEEWRDSIPFGGDRKDERTVRERVTQNSEVRDEHRK